MKGAAAPARADRPPAHRSSWVGASRAEPRRTQTTSPAAYRELHAPWFDTLHSHVLRFRSTRLRCSAAGTRGERRLFVGSELTFRDRRRQDEALAGAGQGDIQQPPLLGFSARLCLGNDRPDGERRNLLVVRVDRLAQEHPVSIAERGATATGRALQVRQADDGPLEPLGLMYGG